MKMTKIKKVTTLILALGVLALGSAFATAATATNQPALPDEIVAAIDSGAVISFYDADGNLLWSSDSETAFDPALTDQIAKVVVTDDSGNVLYDLAVTTNPGGKPVIATDDGYVGLGIFLKEAGITGTASADGTGMQNQEKHQYREEHQNQNGQGCQQQPCADDGEAATDCQPGAGCEGGQHADHGAGHASDHHADHGSGHHGSGK
ncbi:hypothetical protein [Oceanithermus sp.]